MWMPCPTCSGSGKVSYVTSGLKSPCHACGGTGSIDDGTGPLGRSSPPSRPYGPATGGLLTSNKAFSALFGWVVAGYLFWKMFLTGALANDWYFIAPIVAGCLTTWLLRRADWLCTILRRIASVAFFCGFVVAAYYFFMTLAGQ